VAALTIIGLKSGMVKLIAYAPEWKQLFEEEKKRLESALGSLILNIQHVGSTSIPGMIAKPIIDIAIAVEEFEQAKLCIEHIEMLGYEYRGELGIPKRHFFVLGDPRCFHLHMNEVTSDEWQNLILFRDTLVKNKALADEYAALKINLAQRFPDDREAYLEGKANFIERVMNIARKGYT